MKRAPLAIAAIAAALFPALAWAADAPHKTNTAAIGMFGFFVLITLGITAWAARRTHTTKDFYVAGGGVSGFQNGLAIAGDYMSAASFLGISAQIFNDGYDGLIYSIGFLVGWPIIMFLMAEKLRNLGKYTFADVASFRFAQAPVRIFSAFSTLAVVSLYMIAQMVGAGNLIKVLFGLPFNYAVVIVGVLMIFYVLFGGMRATTWVQIIKAGLLLIGASIMAFLVMSKLGFSLSALFSQAVDAKTAAAAAAGASPADAAKKGLSIMGPGNFLKDPISAISFGMALMFGTAGLPHILMRFFTVPNAKTARKSVLWATGWIGYFYVLTFIIGFGAIVLLAGHPEYLGADGKMPANMPAVFLADAVGGNVFMGFISAVAFATILAVVSGLTLSGASAVSHDLYATIIRAKDADTNHELTVSRVTTVVLGLLAIVLGIAFEKLNVAYMVSLAFALAASGNFPVLILSLLWKGMTTRGAVVGGAIGLITALTLMILSNDVWVVVMHHKDAIFRYKSPALFSMPLAFFFIWIVSITDRSARATVDRDGFDDQRVRAETGIGAQGGADH